MLTGQTLRHGHTKRHGHAQRDCLVDVLVNNAMLKSFSKMIKTLRQVLNKTKYNKNFLKKLTANITFTVKKKKKGLSAINLHSSSNAGKVQCILKLFQKC